MEWDHRKMLEELKIMIPILVATACSLVIGLEREYYNKAAGMRTYALVGMGSALFTVVGVYGFGAPAPGMDPTRIAAQIVTGVGFLGAGIIFVRKESVHGLTTAASVWLVAAVGMAAGAGLYLVSALITALYLVVVLLVRVVEQKLWRGRNRDTTRTTLSERSQGAQTKAKPRPDNRK